MSRFLMSALTGIVVLSALGVEDAAAQRRRVVVRRGPVRRTTIVVRPGHPIRRVLPTTVVVRPARTTVVVRAPLVFRPAIVWVPAVVVLPAREQLVWEDSESFEKDEEWVDSNFGVDRSGRALLLQVDGRARLSFAEVTFENGDVQVVDFDDTTHDPGLYELLDFRDGRRVMTVRVLARSESPETTLSVYLKT
jgi:hypothetical protein